MGESEDARARASEEPGVGGRCAKGGGLRVRPRPVGSAGRSALGEGAAWTGGVPGVGVGVGLGDGSELLPLWASWGARKGEARRGGAGRQERLARRLGAGAFPAEPCGT